MRKVPPLQLAVQPITAEPFVTWRQPAKLIATTNAGPFEYPASTASWSSSNPAVATVNASGVIKAVAAGRATISAVRSGVRGTLELTVKSPVLPPKVERIDPFLATPAANSLFEVHVVILRYLPTTDGTNLDVTVNPDFYEPNPITLNALERRPAGMAPALQEERNEAHWYIYWMQSMPGRGNTIPFGTRRMTNWWRFTGDWDGSVQNRLGLYR